VPGNTPSVTRRRGRLPGYVLERVRLAEGFEQADTVAITIQAIEVIEHNRLVTVLVGQKIDAKGGSIAVNPAHLACECTAKTLAFT
jgi:hypothetical protein